MKKVLSLVLAFAMILGSFGFVFASDFSDVKDTEYYSEPVNVLSGLGVIAGFPDGTFKPGDNVTRAQMATMITAALGIPVKGSGATGFSDVPASHWASGYIAYAVSVGFVAGYPDGTFKPENPVSYNEALTMIVASLGYTAESLPGTWPGAFINKAQGLGILSICSTTGNAAAPRQDIACFLYKALTANIGYTDKDGAFHPNLNGEGEADDTMLKRLGAEVYDYDGDKDTKNDKGDFFIVGTETIDSLIDLSNYLGASVTAYINGDKKIVAIKEVRSEFIEGSFDDLDDEYTLKDNDTSVPFFENSDRNGSKTLGFFEGNDTKLKVAVELSGKKVATVYSIQAWTPAKAFEADDKIQDEIIDFQQLGGEDFALDDDDEINTSTFSIVGRDSIKDIKEGDIITIYLHTAKDADGDYDKDDIAKIEVGTETVTGTITKMNKGKTDSTEFTIGGKTYALAFGAEATSEAMYNQMKADEPEATFHLDYNGDIFLIEEDAATTELYGVVLETYREVSTKGEKVAHVVLYLADETSKDFEVDDKKVTDAAEDSGNQYAWANAIKAGTVVQYTLDDDDKIDSLKSGSSIGTDIEISKAGALGTTGKKLASDAVAFNLVDDTAKDKAKSYEVVEISELYSKKVTIDGFANADNSVLAVLVYNLNSTASEKAIFVKANGSSPDGPVWTALYDGEVKNFTLKSDSVANDAKAAQYTTGAATVFLCTLTMDDEVVTGIVPGTAVSFDGMFDNTADAIKVDKNGGITGIVGSSKFNATLADGVAVYVVDGTTWTAKGSSALDVRINTYKGGVYFLYDDDNNIDTVICIK